VGTHMCGVHMLVAASGGCMSFVRLACGMHLACTRAVLARFSIAILGSCIIMLTNHVVYFKSQDCC
jgi:hypothetical protein